MPLGQSAGLPPEDEPPEDELPEDEPLEEPLPEDDPPEEEPLEEALPDAEPLEEAPPEDELPEDNKVPEALSPHATTVQKRANRPTTPLCIQTFTPIANLPCSACTGRRAMDSTIPSTQRDALRGHAESASSKVDGIKTHMSGRCLSLKV